MQSASLSPIVFFRRSRMQQAPRDHFQSQHCRFLRLVLDVAGRNDDSNNNLLLGQTLRILLDLGFAGLIDARMIVLLASEDASSGYQCFAPTAVEEFRNAIHTFSWTFQ